MASGARMRSQSSSDTSTMASATSSRSSLAILGTPSLTGFTKYGYPFMSTTGLARKDSANLGHLAGIAAS